MLSLLRSPFRLWGELKDCRLRLARQEKRLARQGKRLKRQKERISHLNDRLRILEAGQPEVSVQPDYAADGLSVWGKNTEFLRSPKFVESYARGMDSGHKIGRERGSKVDIHIEWRVHMICQAAWHAKHLPGCFVECGVNTGIYSIAVCNYIDFNSIDKDFYLFDTFCGIPEEQMSLTERPARVEENKTMYEECYEVALKNFEPFPRAHLVRGKVPDTLADVNIEKVCYLSIDMNVAEPERAAIEHFWPKLVRGAPIILDDYGWSHYALQKEAMDDFASKKGVKIFTLPTGQGLLLKP